MIERFLGLSLSIIEGMMMMIVRWQRIYETIRMGRICVAQDIVVIELLSCLRSVNLSEQKGATFRERSS